MTDTLIKIFFIAVGGALVAAAWLLVVALVIVIYKWVKED